ncbi:MAG TPA: DUF362 domain-containing protein [Syntrophorhabdales bacterium]|nr:DUF362 domain-containing protein [Syntrophorhabdales bacterium]
MKEKRVITRRDFLRGTAGIIAGVALGAGSLREASAQQQQRPKVVLIRHADAVASDSSFNGEVVQSMLDQAVKALLGESEPTQAWQKLFKKSDVVGIKSNSWNRLPTPKELEKAIHRSLVSIGIPQEKIAIDDRGVLNNPIFQNATALVNARPVRTHHWSGVGTCLKNYIQFVPEPSAYHPEACSDLGRIWTLPIVKGKTRLNVLCALTPQFYGRGASFFDRRYVWPYKGLLVGTDPVAVDALGAELLKRKRIAFFGEDKALDVPPIHITIADTKYHLGVSDLSRIELVKLGWQDDALL